MYYEKIDSINDLLGDEGILRLPAYLPKVFILDDARKEAVKIAMDIIRGGENILIEGKPGTGKTALMFIILAELSKQFAIGYIKEGITSIENKHMQERTIIFYDDIPRMNMEAIKSITKNNVKGIIATARTEEISMMRRIMGINLYDYFKPIRIPPLSQEKIREMLYRYLDAEAIRIEDEEAVEIIVEKAGGLPVYIWQVIRELKIRKQNLTKEFAKTIPQGMLDYVDDILWRLLGGKPERYEALLTLLIMTDFTKYAVHQDLYNYIYLIAKEKRTKQKLGIEDIIMDTTIEDISRYLAREGTTYSFRLPHDSWADVLRGKSNGPMASEIAKIGTLYTKEKRTSIAIEAARRAWWQTIRNIEDPFRKEAFKQNIIINLGEATLKDILERPTIETIQRPTPVTMEAAREVVVVPKETVAMSPIDMLRQNLSKLKVASITMLANTMKMREEEIRNLLDIADFYVQSKRKDFIIYRDYYLAALKKIEDTIQKMGQIEIKRLAEMVKLFPEDIEETIRKIAHIHQGKAYHKEYIWKKIKHEIETKGYINMDEFAAKTGIPHKIIEQYKEQLGKIAIRSPSGKIYYTRQYIEQAIPQKIMTMLTQRKRVNTKEIAQELDIPLSIVEKILEQNAEKSPTNPDIYYLQGTLQKTKQTIEQVTMTGEKSLQQIAEQHRVLLEDIEKIITGTQIEKQYALKRIEHILRQNLKQLNQTPQQQIEELEELAKKLEKHQLNPEQQNILGVANLAIWEKTKKQHYLDKATQILEKAATPKALRNLARAYAKTGKYRQAKKYLR